MSFFKKIFSSEKKETLDKGLEKSKSSFFNKVNKAVVQMDLDGNYITKHHSQIHAARVTSGHRAYISKCCLGKARTSGGFKWCFLSEYKSSP